MKLVHFNVFLGGKRALKGLNLCFNIMNVKLCLLNQELDLCFDIKNKHFNIRFEIQFDNIGVFQSNFKQKNAFVVISLAVAHFV